MALDARIDRLEEALARLACAQARSEAAVLILTREVDRLRETLGFTLEERRSDPGRRVAPESEQRHHEDPRQLRSEAGSSMCGISTSRP
jgi:hypothetical protein